MICLDRQFLCRFGNGRTEDSQIQMYQANRAEYGWPVSPVVPHVFSLICELQVLRHSRFCSKTRQWLVGFRRNIGNKYELLVHKLLKP